jgi:dCMP deaminase
VSPVVVGEPSARPNWDEWLLGIASAVAERADCRRRKVGAVAMHNDTHRILGTGYNGYPAGKPGCLSAGACPRGQRSYEEVSASTTYVGSASGSCDALHAEENLLFELTREERANCTIAVTDDPCPNCRRVLAGSGVTRVIWPGGELTFD